MFAVLVGTLGHEIVLECDSVLVRSFKEGGPKRNQPVTLIVIEFRTQRQADEARKHGLETAAILGSVTFQFNAPKAIWEIPVPEGYEGKLKAHTYDMISVRNYSKQY
jgi:hypothetical protein